MPKIFSRIGFESGSTRFATVGGGDPGGGGGPPPVIPPGGSALCTEKVGTLTDLSGAGIRTTQYANAFAATDTGHRWNAGLNASATTWALVSATAGHIKNLSNAPNCCWHGGKSHGPEVDNNPYDNGWHSGHAMNFGVGQNQLIERFHSWMQGDAFRTGQDWFTDGGPGGEFVDAESSFMDGYIIRDCAGQDNHDDFLEGDWLARGIISECFASGHVIFSGRPANSIENNAGITGVGRTLELYRNVCHLKPQSMIGASTFTNGGAIQADWLNRFFKWPTGSIRPKSMTVLAENNVFRYDGDGRPDNLDGGVPNPVRWGLSNDFMTGGGNIFCCVNGPPADYSNPPGWTLVTGNAAKIAWNNRVREWQAGHSYITLTDRYGAGTGGGNQLLWAGF